MIINSSSDIGDAEIASADLDPGGRPEIDDSDLAGGARIIRVASWLALLIGAIGSASMGGDVGYSVSAAVLSGIFVVAASAIPLGRLLSLRATFDTLSLAGALLTIASVALTGGPDSPYILLAMMPSLFASMIGGFRPGLATSLLSGGLLAGIATLSTDLGGLLAASGTIGLFPLMALLVAQIRTLLLEAERKATRLKEATALAESEMLRLTRANELLRRLTDLYGEGGANPIDVGRSAVETIVESIPGSFATATIFDSGGPMVIARAGTDSPGLERTQFPLKIKDSTSGVVSVGTLVHLPHEDILRIEDLLRPVAVAFANAVLLQDIARSAVTEERLRLARELHDEVGPALAALGFSLDAALMQIGYPELPDQLTSIRERVGGTVDDLRGIIADLRSEPFGSFTAAVNLITSEVRPPPKIEIELHEVRPPRATAARHLLAIVNEAIRNACRHADATYINVQGRVDREAVDIAIVDNGRGFDPSDVPDGHFGVMGMRERADRIGGVIDLRSDAQGTTVRVTWKERR